MDEQEKLERRAHIRLIITEALMFLAVLFLVGFLTLIVMGYSFNFRELGGSGEVVERSGLVQISSMPTGATIAIDGETPLLLSTNASRTMLAGEHEISLTKNGFDGWSKNINVSEGLMYRLNYPRLFRQERESETILTFEKAVYDALKPIVHEEKDGVLKTGGVEFVTVSPNYEKMVMLMDGGLYVLNMNDNEPKLKILEITNADGNLVMINSMTNVEWSGNSERILALVNGRWTVINTRDVRDTVWLDEIVKIEKVRDIKIEGEVGDRLLVLYKTGELVELNVRDKTVDDEILVKNVEQFDNDGDRVVFLTKQELELETDSLINDGLSTKKTEWQVRAYRVGESDSYVIKRFELEQDEALGDVKLATMRYFQESYVGIVRGDLFEIYSKTNWVTSDDEMEKVFDEKTDFAVAKLKKRGKGMVFEIIGSNGEASVFDIEAMTTTQVNTKNTGWVDEYMRYRLADGKLSVLDYDGLNERALVDSDVVSGRVVVISGNGRYLYYFSKKTAKDSTEVLVRERIN